jgi:hypothetical protein
VKPGILSLVILVPKPDTMAARRIDRGSGVVAELRTDAPQLVVHFEGNRHDAENLRSYDDRVIHAAGRLVTSYPTIACGVFHRNDFLVVGTFDVETRRLDLTNLDAVESWCLNP